MYLPLLVVLIERRPILIRLYGGLTYPWIVFNTDASPIEVVQVSSNKFNSNKLNTFPIKIINIQIFQEESSITFQIVTYSSHKHFCLHLTLNSSNYFFNSRNGSNIDRRLVEKTKKKPTDSGQNYRDVFERNQKQFCLFNIWNVYQFSMFCLFWFNFVEIRFEISFLFIPISIFIEISVIAFR